MVEQKTQNLVAGFVVVITICLVIWALTTVYNQKLDKEDKEDEFRTEIETKISVIEGNNDRIDVDVKTIKSSVDEIETKVNSQSQKVETIVETIDYEKIKNEILSYTPVADCINLENPGLNTTTFYCTNR